jgi:sugar/nucleoside kinase (ribokinase family)
VAIPSASLTSPARSFDVICAGALADVVVSGGRPLVRPCGAPSVARALAREGLCVALASHRERDLGEHAVTDVLRGEGVEIDEPAQVPIAAANDAAHEVGAGDSPDAKAIEPIDFAPDTPGAARPIEIPSWWSARVLLWSGVSPNVAEAAACCRAARAARRAGSVVVVDVDARWQAWQGRDGRALRMVLREADVVWASAEDLFGLRMDLSAAREALRPSAVLATTDGAGRALAFGPFGQLSTPPPALPPAGEGHAFTAALCAELARGAPSPASAEPWARALARGHARVLRRHG